MGVGRGLGVGLRLASAFMLKLKFVLIFGICAAFILKLKFESNPFALAFRLIFGMFVLMLFTLTFAGLSP